jgi:hypothetical protein
VCPALCSPNVRIKKVRFNSSLERIYGTKLKKSSAGEGRVREFSKSEFGFLLLMKTVGRYYPTSLETYNTFSHKQETT